MMDIECLVRLRRTVDSFLPDVPSRQTIIDAIDAARWAPNHHLTQPWHFHFPDIDMTGRIIELNAQLVEVKKGREAAEASRRRWKMIPGWLVVSCERSDDPLREKENYAACCCSIYAMSLVLWEREIGVKWTTGDVIRDQRFYDICWIDRRTQEVAGLIWYGYPKQVPHPQPRKDAGEIITEF